MVVFVCVMQLSSCLMRFRLEGGEKLTALHDMVRDREDGFDMKSFGRFCHTWRCLFERLFKSGPLGPI